MHQLIKQCLGVFIVCTPSLVYAFFCPTNFTQINLGDTIEQVTAACGKPDRSTKKEVEPPQAQEWSYFLPQDAPIPGTLSNPAMLKTTVFFDKDGKAINLTVNGIGIGATTICGQSIQIGSTRDQVETACGKPSFVAKQEAGPNGQVEEKKVMTEFFYNSNPPSKLIFENGKLVKRE